MFFLRLTADKSQRTKKPFPPFPETKYVQIQSKHSTAQPGQSSATLPRMDESYFEINCCPEPPSLHHDVAIFNNTRTKLET